MIGSRTYDACLQTPFGGLGINVSNGGVKEVAFLRAGEAGFTSTKPLAKQAIEQLGCYLEDPGFRFDLPLCSQGTPFQQRVWAALRQIPPGSTCSYGEIAKRLGSSARAVGGACRSNPLVLIVPCHRVVSANGLGGFSGETDGEMLAVKRWLLGHEGVLAFGC